MSIPGGAFLHNIHDSPCAQITLGWKGSLLKSGTASHLRDLQDWGRQLSPKEAFCSVVLTPTDPQVWLHRGCGGPGLCDLRGSCSQSGICRSWLCASVGSHGEKVLGAGKVGGFPKSPGFPVPPSVSPCRLSNQFIGSQVFWKSRRLADRDVGSTGSAAHRQRCFAVGRARLHPGISARA